MNQSIEVENVRLITSTEGAGLFEFLDYDNEREWVPWSQIDEGSVDRDGSTGTLVITEWFAKKIGFEV